MLTKFEDEVRECKQYWLEKMCLKKIKLNKVLNKEKMDTMRQDVSEMENVCKCQNDIAG